MTILDVMILLAVVAILQTIATLIGAFDFRKKPPKTRPLDYKAAHNKLWGNK